MTKRQVTLAQRQVRSRRGWAIAFRQDGPYLWTARDTQREAWSWFCRNYSYTIDDAKGQGYRAVKVTLVQGWK